MFERSPNIPVDPVELTCASVGVYSYQKLEKEVESEAKWDDGLCLPLLRQSEDGFPTSSIGNVQKRRKIDECGIGSYEGRQLSIICFC